LQDGKLTSEAFEGDLDRTVYEHIVSDAQHYFLGQTPLFLKSLSLLLPFWNSVVTAIDKFVGYSTCRGS